MARKIIIFLTGLFALAWIAPHISCAESLQWDAVAGDVQGYKIYYGTSSGSYPYSKNVGNVTQYPLPNLYLTDGTTYYFVVRAYADAGESENSNETTYTVPSLGDTTPPLTPQGVKAGSSGVNITLNWQGNTESDLSEYKVYYGNSSRNYGPSIPAGKVTSYTIQYLEVGKTYYLAVSALDSAGNESGYSGEVVETIPSAPDGTEPGEGPMLQWDAVTGDVTGYMIYYGTVSGSYSASKDVGNVTRYPLSDLFLAEGTTYYFVIKAYNNTGESDNSVEVSYSTGESADTTVPVVSIAGPTSGNTYEANTGRVDLSGNASDNVGVSQVNWVNSKGGSGTANGTSPWSISNIQLTEGENVLTVTAEDTAGNQSTDTLTVLYTPLDTVNPAVTITSPSSGSIYETSSSSLNLSGSSSDNVGISQVSWVNSKGGSGTASGTSSWSIANIQLSGGDNVLTVTAEDAAGNQSTDTLTAVFTPLDTTKPVVSITAPTSGSTYTTNSSSINLSGSASDNVGVSQVVWNNDRGGSDITSGTTSWAITDADLAEGDNLITVTAEDDAGNQFNDTLTVTFTPPDTINPLVSITSPTYESTYTVSISSVNLSGAASDNVSVSQIKWSNLKGGKGIAKGTTSWSIPSVQLAEGDNALTITATDAAGNQFNDTITVNYSPLDTTAPLVTIKSPTTRSKFRTNNSSINLSGSASDNVGVSQVNWINSQGGNGTASGTSSWSVSTIPLLGGENILTITAKDATGNQSTDKLTVVRKSTGKRRRK